MVKRLALFLVVVAGCSTEAPGPGEKCDDLVDLLCDRVSGCPGGSSQAECVTLPPATSFACPQASGVSHQYDECLDDVTVAPCSILVATDGTIVMPESCNGAVLYSP